jgi:hypothetical protein
MIHGCGTGRRRAARTRSRPKASPPAVSATRGPLTPDERREPRGTVIVPFGAGFLMASAVRDVVAITVVGPNGERVSEMALTRKALAGCEIQIAAARAALSLPESSR